MEIVEDVGGMIEMEKQPWKELETCEGSYKGKRRTVKKDKGLCNEK